MAKLGKRFRAAKDAVDVDKIYALDEAIEILKSVEGPKFDESVDIALNLGVDPRHADQMVRGAIVLPHGVGKAVRVLVFAKGEKEKEAVDAGADHVGGEELAKKNHQFEAELLVARQLQEQLMAIGFDSQPMYARSGKMWELEASYLYTPSHHLAGDFFYLIPISENRLGILVCDVMGHGIKAALVTMLIRGLMLETPVLLNEPDKVMKHLNDSLVKLAEDPEFPRFVTALYTVIDLNTGNVRLANAGHPAPIWRVEDNSGSHFELCPVEDIGPALGLLPDEIFKGSQFELTQKTELLFYTDGIIEQKTKQGEEWGVENLEETVLDHESDDLPEQLKAISNELKESAGAEELSDDVCIVAVRLFPN